MTTNCFVAAPAGLAAVLVVSGLVASSACAGDWSGPYIGVHAGAERAGDPLDLGPASPLASYHFNSGYLPRSVSLEDRGFAGGVLAGYNWRAGILVVGAEVDITALAGGGREETVGYKDAFTEYRTEAAAELNNIATLRARMGFLVDARTLLYATGGLAAGHASLAVHAFDVGSGCGNGSGLCITGNESGWSTGWVVGGGAEFLFAENWTLRGEFLHYDLGSIGFEMVQAPPHDDYVYSARTEFSGDIVRGTINYHY